MDINLFSEENVSGKNFVYITARLITDTKCKSLEINKTGIHSTLLVG
jgi:hypothetical protein